MEKKISKSIALAPSIIELIENFAKTNGVSFSTAAENLFLASFGNIETTKELLEIQKSENAKLRKQIKDTNERQIAFMEEILRFTAMSFGWAKLSAASTTGSGDYVKNVLLNLENQNMEEGRMIKRAFKSLSEQKARKEEEDFFNEV